MSKVKVLGYSERGIINSIVFFLKDQPQHISDFIKILDLKDQYDFFDNNCDYTFLNEQSFSDFGSNDWTIIAEKDEKKRVIFIEAKRGKSYNIEEEFKKINEYCKCLGNKEYGGVSSNIFAQLYYKFLLTKLDESNEFKISKIGKKIKKLGENEVVKYAYKNFIKDVSEEHYYYVAILPKEVEFFSKKFGDLNLGMSEDYINSVSWKKIEQFFHSINATSVIENFNFNKNQIY